MKDIYVLEQASSPKSVLSDTLSSEDPEVIENENYTKSKETRLKLERLLSMQESTTEVLKKQGEKLKKIKQSAFQLNSNADIARTIGLKLEDESSTFGNYTSFFTKIKRWWSTDTAPRVEIEEIKNREETGCKDYTENVEEQAFEPSKNEYIPGENKTELELNNIYNAVRKLNAGARTQIEIVKEQNEDISDIKKINNHTEKSIVQTESMIRKK